MVASGRHGRQAGEGSFNLIKRAFHVISDMLLGSIGVLSVSAVYMD